MASWNYHLLTGKSTISTIVHCKVPVLCTEYDLYIVILGNPGLGKCPLYITMLMENTGLGKCNLYIVMLMENTGLGKCTVYISSVQIFAVLENRFIILSLQLSGRENVI